MRLRPRYLFLMVCLFIVGCGGSDRPGAANDSVDQTIEIPTVALIMKSLANEYFVTMATGAREHQDEHQSEYRLIVNGIKNEIDLAQQVALVDQMIASGVDAIVIAPADSKALVPALARAAAAGIVVINIDNRLDAEILKEYDFTAPFVGPDNFLGAETVARYLAERLTAGQQVAILEGVPTAHNSQRRTAGFLKAMMEGGLDVVAQQSAQWDQTMAVTVTSGILVQHPDLAAILCANDNMALGAVAAVTQGGKRGEIKIIGIDNISAAHNLIEEGVMLATLDQHADLLAVEGIKYALEALRADVVLVDKFTALDLVTAETIE